MDKDLSEKYFLKFKELVRKKVDRGHCLRKTFWF